ncbi:unnamed protein product [Chironomus riparius]|uniref:Uncharacterized protein n=1 Tax=Chironomus riparius TaxID=315576 RepID=A0A9N9RM35_9DIPT|nr:unnamed protein product [Chironomus riparius]
MKITLLAICCFAVVLSTYAAPQSLSNNPETGNQNPTKEPQKDPTKSQQNNQSKGSQNKPSKGTQNSPSNGSQKKGNQQDANKKNNAQSSKGSKKVGNSQQKPPTGLNEHNYNQNNIDVKKTFNGNAASAKGAFYKK